MPAVQTVLGLLKNAEATLSSVSKELARRDAEIMLAHVLNTSVSRLPIYDQDLIPEQLKQFERYTIARSTGKPVAYIVGEQEFWSLNFKVNEHTLVPRPDTETLVEVGLKQLSASDPAYVLDLGTGSGCVLLSILFDRPLTKGVGVDKSRAALDVAKLNAKQLGLSDRCKFRKGDWYKDLGKGEQFDLIVSNPPYIESSDMKMLMPDVREFEPATALDGGPDGLDCYRRIAAGAPEFLRPGGVIAVEVGKGQDRDVAGLFYAAGLEPVAKYEDLAGIKRVVTAKKAVDS